MMSVLYTWGSSHYESGFMIGMRVMYSLSYSESREDDESPLWVTCVTSLVTTTQLAHLSTGAHQVAVTLDSTLFNQDG
jgi:hypothetical protein